MNTHLRVIWAIAAKDVADAVKNRTTLSVLLSMLFLHERKTG